MLEGDAIIHLCGHHGAGEEFRDSIVIARRRSVLVKRDYTEGCNDRPTPKRRVEHFIPEKCSFSQILAATTKGTDLQVHTRSYRGTPRGARRGDARRESVMMQLYAGGGRYQPAERAA